MLYLPNTCWWFEDQGRYFFHGIRRSQVVEACLWSTASAKGAGNDLQSGGLVGLKIGDGPNFCGSLTVENKACHVGLPWVSLFSDKAMYALNVFAVFLVDHVCLVKSLFLLFNLNWAAALRCSTSQDVADRGCPPRQWSRIVAHSNQNHPVLYSCPA